MESRQDCLISGEKGYAYTLLTDADKEMAGHLVRNLESVNQTVPDALLQLALKSAWFRSSRGEQGNKQGPKRLGLGYKPRTRPTAGAGSLDSEMVVVYCYCVDEIIKLVVVGMERKLMQYRNS